MRSIKSASISSLAYKSYVANLTQVGSDPPTAQVFNNELGPITFQYVSLGVYNIISGNKFTANKTWFIQTQTLYGVGGGGSFSIILSLQDGSTIEIDTSDNISGPADNVLSAYPIEIRVYN